MKKIVLFCSTGTSTSLLVNKMREEAQSAGKDYDIDAYPLSQLREKTMDADVILLGPQVRFLAPKVAGALPETPVGVIDMRAYGMMDGKAILALADKLMR